VLSTSGNHQYLRHHLADLDGDGDLDAVTENDAAYANATACGVRLTTNDVLTLAGTLPQANALAVGDLDLDGDSDVFSVHNGADKVWLNDGAANFTVHPRSLGLTLGRDVALGDLDGDGDLDAFVASDGSDEVWLNQTK
jgi:hypothetical protein